MKPGDVYVLDLPEKAGQANPANNFIDGDCDGHRIALVKVFKIGSPIGDCQCGNRWAVEPEWLKSAVAIGDLSLTPILSVGTTAPPACSCSISQLFHGSGCRCGHIVPYAQRKVIR